MRDAVYRRLLFVGGWLALGFAVLGIPLPLLPVTPFVLLAAWCFARSSPRFHHWLLHHRFFGPIVKKFGAGQGLPRRVRRRVIALMWSMMALSAWLLGSLPVAGGLVVIGAAVTVYLMRQPVYD